MQRILTGYAISFNRKHHRHSHLFQNGYKFILRREDTYLLELVRYIHLNPLRAGIVRDISGLENYPYCGLSSFFVKVSPPWQDTGYVLKESKGLDLESVAKKVGKLTEIKPHDLFSSDRQHSTVQARSLLCFWAYEEIGMTQPEVGSNLSMTQAAVSHAIKRERGVAAENKFRLF